MRSVAEDVYYVARDGRQAFGLNQLMAVPGLSEIELAAIEGMCDRSSGTMRMRATAQPVPPLRHDGSIMDLPHGLYYVGPGGQVWLISEELARPDLQGPAMDFAIATVASGLENLSRMRRELKQI